MSVHTWLEWICVKILTSRTSIWRCQSLKFIRHHLSCGSDFRWFSLFESFMLFSLKIWRIIRSLATKLLNISVKIIGTMILRFRITRIEIDFNFLRLWDETCFSNIYTAWVNIKLTRKLMLLKQCLERLCGLPLLVSILDLLVVLNGAPRINMVCLCIYN